MREANKTKQETFVARKKAYDHDGQLALNLSDDLDDKESIPVISIKQESGTYYTALSFQCLPVKQKVKNAHGKKVELSPLQKAIIDSQRQFFEEALRCNESVWNRCVSIYNLMSSFFVKNEGIKDKKHGKYFLASPIVPSHIIYKEGKWFDLRSKKSLEDSEIKDIPWSCPLPQPEIQLVIPYNKAKGQEQQIFTLEEILAYINDKGIGYIEKMREDKGAYYTRSLYDHNGENPVTTVSNLIQLESQLMKRFSQQSMKGFKIDYMGEKRVLLYENYSQRFYYNTVGNFIKSLESFYSQTLGTERRPKRKGVKNPLNSLSHANPEGLTFDFQNNQIGFGQNKKLGLLAVPGLTRLKNLLLSQYPELSKLSLEEQNKRLKSFIKVVKYIKKEEFWEVHLTIETKKPLSKYTGLMCGIDPGHSEIATLDNGFAINNPRHLRDSTGTLAFLQQKLSLKLIKTTKKDSSNINQLKQDIKALHGKIRKERKGLQQWYASHIVSQFDVLFCGNYRAKIKKNKAKSEVNNEGKQTGKFLTNGQCIRRGMNKSAVDASLGNFFSLIDQYCNKYNKVLIEVNEDFTSQMCPRCGQLNKKKLSERHHHCQCGFSLSQGKEIMENQTFGSGRDTVAAINIKLKGLAILLSLTDQELQETLLGKTTKPAKANLIKIKNGETLFTLYGDISQIRQRLEQEERNTLANLREPIASDFNPWRLFLQTTPQQYLDRTTPSAPPANLTVTEVHQNLTQYNRITSQKM